MITNSNRAVIYREDVQSALNCCPSTALLIMKRTGCAFKVGKRWAINEREFNGILQGKQRNQMEVR